MSRGVRRVGFRLLGGDLAVEEGELLLGEGALALEFVQAVGHGGKESGWGASGQAQDSGRRRRGHEGRPYIYRRH